MNRILISLLLSLFVLPLCAQSEHWNMMKKGNEAFQQGDYAKAEKCYLSAMQEQPENASAHYNLGCTYMEQGNREAALQAFADAVRLSKDDELTARAWHNIGVIHEGQALVEQNERINLLTKAVDAYKESLRVNPSDEETRYNLALCQHQLRSDNNQQDKDEQQQNDQQQPQDEPQQQQDPTQQLMNLAQRAEDDTRQKINEARSQQSGLDKNW